MMTMKPKGNKMTNELYDYIYDAMCWVLEMMDDIKLDPKYIERYDKLDKAIGKFQKWYFEKN